MKTFLKITAVAVACLLAVAAGAAPLSQTDVLTPTHSQSASGPEQEIEATQQPDFDMWDSVVENCQNNGGFKGAPLIGFDIEKNVTYRTPEDNGFSLVFDPILNRLVSVGELIGESKSTTAFKEILDKVFTDLNLKNKGAETVANMLPTGPRFKEVVAGFEAEYLKRGVVFEYAQNKVSVIDPKSPAVHDYLLSINLHNRLIVAAANAKTCDKPLVKNALKDAETEVAGLKRCTGKINASLPFLNHPMSLNCDGQEFAIIGGWTAAK